LSDRFVQTSEIDNLQQAIRLSEQAVTAFPIDHPGRAATLSSLSIKLGYRFERTGDLDDLQRAILLAEETVAKTPIPYTLTSCRLVAFCVEI